MHNEFVKKLRGLRVLHLAAADSMLNPNLREQLIFLRECGCAVSTASIDGPLGRRLRDEDGFPWTPLPLSRELAPFSDLHAVRFVQDFCTRNRFDIVHTHTPKGNLIGQWGARLAGTPIVLQTLHGFYFHDRMNPLTRRAWIEIERFSASHSDHILCQNPEDVETAVRERIVERGRITELGNGIDLVRFTPVDAAGRQAARRRLEIPCEAFVIGMVGRFVKEKGFPEFLQAAQIVARQCKNAYFLAIGHDVTSERLNQRFTFESGQGSHEEFFHQSVKILRNRDDMPDLYAAMDVHCLPSHREGFPRCLLEGAAMGIPQVATDIRGCRQAVTDGETGFLIEPGDSASLANRVIQLLNDPALCLKMGRAARILAEKTFDRNEVFARLANCYCARVQ